LYSLGRRPDRNWGAEPPVPGFVWQQLYQYKILPSQLIAQQEFHDDASDATVLMADDVKLKTLSPSQRTKVKKMFLDCCGKWIMGSVQDSIFHSFNFTATQDALESDSMAAAGES
jgi:hypothetical protein